MTGPIAVPYGWDIRTNDGMVYLKYFLISH